MHVENRQRLELKEFLKEKKPDRTQPHNPKSLSSVNRGEQAGLTHHEECCQSDIKLICQSTESKIQATMGMSNACSRQHTKIGIPKKAEFFYVHINIQCIYKLYDTHPLLK